MAKKVTKKKKKCLLAQLQTRKCQRNAKNCFYLRWLGSSLVFKKEIRIWLKKLRNIAMKLATGEVTIMCNFDKNLEKFKF